MSKGYAVFRALSPSSPCDLIAVRGDRLWRIEVRKAEKLNADGTYKGRNQDLWRQDYFAVVLPDSTIQYFPVHPELSAL